MAITEKQRVTALWETTQEPLRRVLVTRAEPRLAWMPNEHNAATIVMAQNQRAELDAALQVRGSTVIVPYMCHTVFALVLAASLMQHATKLIEDLRRIRSCVEFCVS